MDKLGRPFHKLGASWKRSTNRGHQACPQSSILLWLSITLALNPQLWSVLCRASAYVNVFHPKRVWFFSISWLSFLFVLNANTEFIVKQCFIKMSEYIISVMDNTYSIVWLCARCGNPHFCGGYDVEDTKVCVRSTLTLRRLQKSDSGTYFCQEGLHKGSYSFAYIVNVSLFIVSHIVPTNPT